ncbi:MAG: DNA-processing protein DprA [Candidatus Muirbacterium halophilum]|nr:DNA-processing protein DprA [Candidatus Muirbacterium halophilum]MCK9474624.1 DNA-processing protein DprA [Candidatus Muirbacterium halophilum]
MVSDIVKFASFYVPSIKRLDYFKKNKNDLLNKYSLEQSFGKEKTKFFFELLNNKKKDIDKILLEEKNGDLKIIDWFSDEYPQRLKQIPDAPPFIFVRGNCELLHRDTIVAMVGARKTDEYGKRVAEEISHKVSVNNVTIVSGLAAGIDSICHLGSIESNGSTIAVTAVDCGGFPAVNRELCEKIKNKGLLVSEYPYSIEVRPEMFVIRNRIIAGLSDGVVVMRATLKSGSLWTAEFALNYDRDVMAVPGNIYENLSSGTNVLIKRGAVAVFNYKDVLDYINVDEITFEERKELLLELSLSEKKILSHMCAKEIYIDDLIIKTKIPSYETMRLLNMLVFKGFVKKIPGNKFYKNI